MTEGIKNQPTLATKVTLNSPLNKEVEEPLSNELQQNNVNIVTTQLKSTAKVQDDLKLINKQPQLLHGKFSDKRSKDDLSLSSLEERQNRLKELTVPKEDNDKVEGKSRIGRVFASIMNAKPMKLLKDLGGRFSNSKIGKVALSNVLWRSVTIVTTAIALIGLFTPISPVIIAASAISLAAVGAIAAIDGIKARNLRRLEKECNALVKYRNDKSKQEYILKELAPSLGDKLNALSEKEFYKVKEDSKKLDQDKYYVDPNSPIAKGIGLAILNNIPSVIGIVSGTITGNVAPIITAAKSGVAGASLAGFTLDEKKLEDVNLALKVIINNEYKKEDVHNYKNLKELQKTVEEQHIQTLALSELLTMGLDEKDKSLKDKYANINNVDIDMLDEQGRIKEAHKILNIQESYWQMSDDQRIAKFIELKEQICFREKKIEDNNKNIFVRMVKKLGNYVKYTGKAHDPFYTPPKANDYNILAKVQEEKGQVAKNVMIPPTITKPLQRSVSLENLSDKSKGETYSGRVNNDRSKSESDIGRTQ